MAYIIRGYNFLEKITSFWTKLLSSVKFKMKITKLIMTLKQAMGETIKQF